VSEAFVQSTALACALGADLETAVGRLHGEPRPPTRKVPAAGPWPYFAIPVENADWMQRTQAIARAVAHELRRKASLSPEEWERLPCLVGSSCSSVGAWDDGGLPALQAPLEFGRMLAGVFGVRGPVMLANTACTSGLSALDLGLSLLAAGTCGKALVIGVEVVNRLTVAGFAGLELLSATAARPCDRDRDGLVLGEALAAMLVSASGGAWRIAALASATDAASLTGPAPDGRVIARAMRDALAAARWTGDSVDLVKLQAAGGTLADLAEARAVREIFPVPPSLVSLKGAIGHTLGASGPAELALLLESIARGRVPRTWGFAARDPELALEPEGGDAGAVKRVLFNLSGFGGSVMSLALERAA
jgi:3-oxoacyl-[acyl-carrier-protein] synthase-1